MTETHCDCGLRFSYVTAEARLCDCGRLYDRRDGYWAISRTAQPAWDAWSNAASVVATKGSVLTIEAFLDAVRTLEAGRATPLNSSLPISPLQIPMQAWDERYDVVRRFVEPFCYFCGRDARMFGAQWMSCPPNGYETASSLSGFRKPVYRLHGKRFVIIAGRVCHPSHLEPRRLHAERYAHVLWLAPDGETGRYSLLRHSKLTRAVDDETLFVGWCSNQNRQSERYRIIADGGDLVLMCGESEVIRGDRDRVLACVPDARSVGRYWLWARPCASEHQRARDSLCEHPVQWVSTRCRDCGLLGGEGVVRLQAVTPRAPAHSPPHK